MSEDTTTKLIAALRALPPKTPVPASMFADTVDLVTRQSRVVEQQTETIAKQTRAIEELARRLAALGRAVKLANESRAQIIDAVEVIGARLDEIETTQQGHGCR